MARYVYRSWTHNLRAPRPLWANAGLHLGSLTIILESMSHRLAQHLEKPLRQREHHAFLSHAHADKKSVEKLFRWLRDTAGLQIYYDAEEIPAGQQFPLALAEGIADSQSIIIAVSKESVERGWVTYELNMGLQQKIQNPRFSVIPVRLENCSLPTSLLAHSAVNAFDGNLDGQEAARLLRGIHGLPDLTVPAAVKTQVIQHISALAGDTPAAATSSNIRLAYVTSGWRNATKEKFLRQIACQAFAKAHFHLLGDTEDHQHTDEARIKSIMSGCSAHVIILPRRADDLSHHEYKSIRSEIAWGSATGLPQFVVAEKGILLPNNLGVSVVTLDPSDSGTNLATLGLQLDEWAEGLRAKCNPPIHPHFVFVATDYEDIAVKDHVVRHITQITGLPCLKGSDFGGQMPSRKIETAIRNASLVIANIASESSPTGLPNVNWNSCIEAGMAMGAQREVRIIARRGENETWRIHDHIPFMIRHNTIDTYADDQQLLGLVHRHARPFRRRVISVNDTN